MDRRFSLSSMMKFKSKVNELRLIQKLLEYGEIHPPAAAREIQSLQIEFFRLSQDRPKRRRRR